MRKVESPVEDVGVIIGRFQVNDLHTAHLDLIQSVCNLHEKVIVFLGLSPLMGTQNNPLDFESRKQMIMEKFPQVIVMYMKDVHDDNLWSKDLDIKISDLVSPTQSVVLYGSRDSFISSYSGKFKTQELMQEVYISGSEIRKSISKKVKNTPEFRAGVIWSVYNKSPICFPTVSVAICNEDYTKVLLVKNDYEVCYRFIEGFADPNSDKYETDVRREVAKNTSLEISEPMYVCSMKIDNWKYKHEVDKIKTSFYCSKVIFGRPEAKGDIAEVRWFDLKKLPTNFTTCHLLPEHRQLFEKLTEFLKEQTKETKGEKA